MVSGPAVLMFAVLATVVADSSCPAGSFRNIHTGQCSPCPATTYSVSPNNQSQCSRCRMCTGGKFEILHPCLATSNTVCGCKQGFMCTGKDCKSCKPHMKCKKGQEVEQKGDSFRDTKCKDCKSGTYSDTVDGVCKPWTDCSAKGLQVVRNGSRSENVMCGSPLTTPVPITNPGWFKPRTPTQPDRPKIQDNKNDGIVAVIAIVLLPCVFIPFTLYVVIQSKRKQKPIPMDMKSNDVLEELPFALTVTTDDRCSCHSPEEETGDWQLRQETTPKPPE
ncbi:tumor necrosis factor receptor superfamily member 9-like [Pristis pectinata]|uniref:tumor necrosis factor receptor superfamily member 9-like n=1 Tax=Pristis pectinata TaxID=685728 RepID=UPI00223D176F|nr:tumor necrosis factor receptor superfamily member 9-like [Pristis pectinata]